jgi:hypothetical protein
MKVLLWLLQEIGVPKVPSFDALKKIQKKIKKEHIVPTTQWMSPKGNAFSFNNPRAIIANVSFFSTRVTNTTYRLLSERIGPILQLQNIYSIIQSSQALALFRKSGMAESGVMTWTVIF